MWIGTWDEGLNRYDRKTGRFFHYMPDINNPSSISGRNIWNLAIDKNDTLWLGTFNVGTDLFDKNKGVIRRFRANPDNPKAIVGKGDWVFFEDSEKNIWISTTTGLNFYDSKTNSFKKYIFHDNVISAFCKDKDGNLWVGTNSKGIIPSEETKKSVAFPTISPNGKFMLFCMVDFGYFPVNNKTSDLYLMDMRTNKYYKPDINSDESESYISWSSNSKWFVFSSRRLDGVTSKPFICSIDSLGNTSKPFILPQEDPLFYTINHKNFARPELIKHKFNLNFGDLKEVIYSKAIQAIDGSAASQDSSH